jgi:YaiO family outer membrane protein
MQRKRSHSAMRWAVRVAAALGAIGVAGFAMAQVGLWDDRGGLGLRPSPSEAAPLPPGSHSNSGDQVQTPKSRDYELYSGVRELPQLGSTVSESYGGVEYSFSRKWGSSLEAGVIPQSASTPRRYSLAGQLQTTLSEGRGVSVGLKYSHYDAVPALRGGLYGGEPLGSAGGNELTPLTAPGLYTGPSYEVRLRYQHSASSSFGLTLGRDLDTLTPHADAATNGERQLMFTGQHWLTPKWGLSYDLLSDEPGGSMRVQGLRLGVRYRF